MIVLSSAKAVKELIDKRGWVASSRPPNFLIDQINNGQHVAFMPAGPFASQLWRSYLIPATQVPNLRLSGRPSRPCYRLRQR